MNKKRPATVRLRCHAPHPDPWKRHERCASILGDIALAGDFVTTASTAPASPDGSIWVRCPRAECQQWNAFRVIVPKRRSACA